MSRAYMECEHYRVFYPEDTVVVGAMEYCDECGGWRKVVRKTADDSNETAVANTEAMQVFTQFLDMLKNGPDETLELWKLVTSINHPAISQERRVSKIETTCPTCGYVEDIVFSPEFYQEHNGKFVDVLASMLELMGNCPQCEEDRRLASIESEEETDAM